jgi:hypothetical protein
MVVFAVLCLRKRQDDGKVAVAPPPEPAEAVPVDPDADCAM